MNGGDYSLARPGGAALKAAGFTWVARYLCSYVPKRLSADERDDLFANDLSIVLVFEDDTMQALNGYSQGVLDAQEALDQANALGVPSSVPIFMAVDFDATEAQQSAINEYFEGVISVLGLNRTAGYGGYWILLRLANAGLISYKWQTIAWSGGMQVPGINIYQDGTQAFNGGVDNDVSKTDNFGQWSNQQGVQPVIVGDGDNWFSRFNKAMVQIRGRQASRDELTPFVGQDSLHMFETIMDDPEADQATADQTLGYTARTANWQGEISDLQGQVQLLDSQNKLLQTQVTGLQEPTIPETVPDTPIAVVTKKQNFITVFIKWFFK